MAPDTGNAVPGGQGGLFDSIKRLSAHLITVVHTRIELAALDWEEEQVRLGVMLAWGLVALFCAGIGIILLTALIVVAFWDSHRLLVLGLLAALFLGAALAALLILSTKARNKPRLFAATLAELAKDREHLSTGP